MDKILVDRGLVKSRERARALIMEGKVLVADGKVSKAGTMVPADADIRLLDEDIPFVSRGGLKLEAAISFFGIDPAGLVVMDVGCSTGGFTDCVLKKGARKVYAIDVGYGQFDWSLRGDPRVVLLEKTNIRYLEQESVPDRIDLAVIDVSFISLVKVLPRVFAFLSQEGKALALVKPQFEVGRGLVGKGGIVRDESARLDSVERVKEGVAEMGFATQGVFESPVRGQKGNIEYFIVMGRR